MAITKGNKNELGILQPKTDFKCRINPYALKQSKSCRAKKDEKFSPLGLNSYVRLGVIYMAGMALGTCSLLVEILSQRLNF